VGLGGVDVFGYWGWLRGFWGVMDFGGWRGSIEVGRFFAIEMAFDV